MFGTRNAVPKFRAVSTLSPDEQELLIRDWEWQPIIIPFQDGYTCVRTLGIQINIVGVWSDQIQEASNCLARVGNVIRAKKGSSYSKISTINLSVTQGMLHKGAHSVWSQKAIAKLEVHISCMIRIALKLPSTYPVALIYAKTGELGIQSFSQMHREGTERVTARCLYGPEPGTSAARGIANRAFRTSAGEDRGLGQGTATSSFPKANTYIKTLLSHAAKEQDVWHRQGRPQGQQQEHIAVALQGQSPAFFKWARSYDIQYITELTDWTSGFRGVHPLMPWVATGSEQIRDGANKMIQQATASLSRDWKIPITRGHVILLQEGAYGTGTFF
jgi:hypothetical protein